MSKPRTPKYRKHRASGQAIVTLNGKDYFLGPYGTAASEREYDRLIAEWLANGRRAPVEDNSGVTAMELWPRSGHTPRRTTSMPKGSRTRKRRTIARSSNG